MKIGIDLDDVLTDLISELINFYNHKYNKKAERKDIFSWDFFPKEIHEDFSSSGGYKKLKSMPHAKDLLEFLNLRGEVSIITIRNNRYSQDTFEWLEKNLPGLYNKEQIFLTSGNKLDKCKELKLDLLIDDSIGFTKLAAENGIYAILFENGTSMYNNIEKHPKIYRAKSIEDIKKHVLKIKNLLAT